MNKVKEIKPNLREYYSNLHLNSNEKEIFKRALIIKKKRDNKPTFGHIFKRIIRKSNKYNSNEYTPQMKKILLNYNRNTKNNSSKSRLISKYTQKQSNYKYITNETSNLNNNSKITKNNLNKQLPTEAQINALKFIIDEYKSLKKIIPKGVDIPEKSILLPNSYQSEEYKNYNEMLRQLKRYKDIIKQCKNNLSEVITMRKKFLTERDELFKTEFESSIKKWINPRLTIDPYIINEIPKPDPIMSFKNNRPKIKAKYNILKKRYYPTFQ